MKVSGSEIMKKSHYSAIFTPGNLLCRDDDLPYLFSLNMDV